MANAPARMARSILEARTLIRPAAAGSFSVMTTRATPEPPGLSVVAAGIIV